jgi:hypothetical protein
MLANSIINAIYQITLFNIPFIYCYIWGRSFLSVTSMDRCRFHKVMASLKIRSNCTYNQITETFTIKSYYQYDQMITSSSIQAHLHANGTMRSVPEN